jgi:hypothetical protein
MLSLPQAWYRFEGVLELVADRKLLLGALFFTYAATCASFVGLFIYYSSLSVEETLVGDDYKVDGYTCRPLTPDPEYGLNITYDECLEKHYIAPTIENVEVYGTYEPAYTDASESYVSYDGPWNFSYTRSKEGMLTFSMYTMTEYHKPFPELTSQIYTYNKKCRVPYYLNAEAKADHIPDATAYQSMRWATDETIRHGIAYATAYPPFGFGNRDFNITQSDFGRKYWTDIVFFPDSATDFVSECAGNFSSAMQADLKANGAYVFPRGFGRSQSWWSEANFAGTESVFHINMEDRSIGMTPLYPKTTTLSAHTWENTVGLTRHDAHSFFGLTPRCRFYEKKLAVEAFEFIYNHSDCHPCDSFKYAAPFFCVRRVKKSAAEAISLAASNTMAILGVLIAGIPPIIAFAHKSKQVGRGHVRGQDSTSKAHTVSTSQIP